MKITAIVNPKGGSAKTTTAREMSLELSRRGLKVLLVDLDPTANLSKLIGADITNVVGIGHAMIDSETTAEDTVQNIEYKDAVIDVSAGGPILETVKNAILGKPDGQFRLADALEEISGYDHVILDTPGDLGILTINALVAAECVIIPVLPEKESRETLGGVVDGIRTIQKRTNSRLNIGGFLICRWRTSADAPKEEAAIIEAFAERAGESVYKTRIRQSDAKDDRRNLKLIDYKDFVSEYLETA